MQHLTRVLLAALAAALLHVVSIAAKTVEHDWTISSLYEAPDGHYRMTFGINSQTPGPVLNLDEGDSVSISIHNTLQVEITIHWHGIFQIGSPEMDGVPGVTQWVIPPMGDYTYEFEPKGQAGLHWYHAHLRGYLDDGVKGLIYIKPSDDRERPFSMIDSNAEDMEKMVEAEREPRNLAMYDWRHVQEDEALAMFFSSGRPTTCVDSVLFNGKGRTYCPSPEFLNQASGGRFDAMPFFESKLDPRGCLVIPGSGSYNPHAITSPMGCSNSSSPIEIISTHPSGWTLINIANVGGEWTWVLSIDAHDMWVVAADGDYVRPEQVQALPVSIGQRYAVLVRTDKQEGGDYYIRANSAGFAQVMGGVGILRYQDARPEKRVVEQTSFAAKDPWSDLARAHVKYNSTPVDGAVMFDPTRSSPFIADAPPPTPDQTFIFHANQSEPTVFSIASRPLRMVEEFNLPVLFSNSSHYSGTPDPDWLIRIPKGAVIDIILQNAQNALFPAPAEPPHPIHLHGHKFWVLGSKEYDDWRYQSAQDAIDNGVELNLSNPAKRDTVLLPTAGWLVLRFVADNPGAWMMHCHITSHHMAGMGVVFLEGEDEIASIPDHFKQRPIAHVPHEGWDTAAATKRALTEGSASHPALFV